MTVQEKIALLEDMLELDEGSLKAADELASLESWDSLAVLSLVVLMDENFGKTLTYQDVKGFQTIQDILDFMA